MTFFCIDVEDMMFIFVIVCVASREGAVGCVENSVLGLVVLLLAVLEGTSAGFVE